eukprot:TRINITY_DN14246_c0_g3_i1.p1 TRINITY_DN14246_c0_g3~~TRINITY_DN14246_c0_g3_i1.p1  ORF type:complete len:1424 (-),score=189.44 TRINITY_DN14246_c0_g3_i1:327-4547(-)
MRSTFALLCAFASALEVYAFFSWTPLSVPVAPPLRGPLEKSGSLASRSVQASKPGSGAPQADQEASPQWHGQHDVAAALRGSSLSCKALEAKLETIFSSRMSPQVQSMYAKSEALHLPTLSNGEPSISAVLDRLELARPAETAFDINSMVGEWRLEYTRELPMSMRKEVEQYVDEEPVNGVSIVLYVSETGFIETKAVVALQGRVQLVGKLRSIITQTGSSPHFSLNCQHKSRAQACLNGCLRCYDEEIKSILVTYVSEDLMILRKNTEDDSFFQEALKYAGISHRAAPWTDVWRKIDPAKQFRGKTAVEYAPLWRLGLAHKMFRIDEAVKSMTDERPPIAILEGQKDANHVAKDSTTSAETVLLGTFFAALSFAAFASLVARKAKPRAQKPPSISLELAHLPSAQPMMTVSTIWGSRSRIAAFAGEKCCAHVSHKSKIRLPLCIHRSPTVDIEKKHLVAADIESEDQKRIGDDLKKNQDEDKSAFEAASLSSEIENERLLKEFEARIEDINQLEEEIENLDDKALRLKVEDVRAAMDAEGRTVKNVNMAFAIVREAVWRVLELWYFDVQILGGLVLNEGRLAEIKTGEGKTIVALLPAFVAALEGKGGVFIVTPNDYLARRDAENAGQVLRFLGVSVGLVQSSMEYEERGKAYDNDVVYLTNAELGFDYLRDNLAVYKHQIVQKRSFYFCLVDEADSILIDESRTPLIISEAVPAAPRQFVAAKAVVDNLRRDVHYTVDETKMHAYLTDIGEKYAQDLFGVDDLWEPEEAWILYTTNAIKAKELFKRNKDYIIQDGKIAMFDNFTGRVFEGRRWADGIHQAIEAKENIAVSVRLQVSAQITYQSLFKLFPRLCAMTGTGLTEAAEFEDVYNLRVTAIPTARPSVRSDYPDVVYTTVDAKMKALAEKVSLLRERNGRPILIGTANAKTSEQIVSLLSERGIESALLNGRAEAVARESEIIANAGRLGAVTVATNMAGRGTDILLGGNPSIMSILYVRGVLAETLLPLQEQRGVPPVDEDFFPCDMPYELEDRLLLAVDGIAASEVGRRISDFNDLEQFLAIVACEAPFEPGPSVGALEEMRKAFRAITNLYKYVLAAERDAVVKCGGLYVLGTSRHESIRLDNQLRGRAGRQGDPGTTRFFVSLEDNIFRVFGGERVYSLIERFRLADNLPLQSSIVDNTVANVQAYVDGLLKERRATLFEFDKVISKQRELTYNNRRQYLETSLGSWNEIETLVYQWGRAGVQVYLENVKDLTSDQLAEREQEFANYFGIPLPGLSSDAWVPTGSLEPKKELVESLEKAVKDAISKQWAAYEEFREGFACEAAQICIVVTIDDDWKVLLQRMDALKHIVDLRAYKGTDPLQEYRVQGFRMYERSSTSYQAKSISRWLRSKPKDTHRSLEKGRGTR